MNPEGVTDKLKEQFQEGIVRLPDFRGETSFRLLVSGEVAHAAMLLKNGCGFDYLVDISAVDHLGVPGEKHRFELVYHLYSYASGHHLRLKTFVAEASGGLSSLPSITLVFQAANWHEREIYDLMGIRFDGHPDLRRILMWDGYPHHPLRKDFPLEGLPVETGDGRFTQSAAMEGGPFVASFSPSATGREPRSQTPSV